MFLQNFATSWVCPLADPKFSSRIWIKPTLNFPLTKSNDLQMPAEGSLYTLTERWQNVQCATHPFDVHNAAQLGRLCDS